MKQYQGTKKKDFDELIEFINKASTLGYSLHSFTESNGVFYAICAYRDNYKCNCCNFVFINGHTYCQKYTKE